jgi:hypothetical protein
MVNRVMRRPANINDHGHGGDTHKVDRSAQLFTGHQFHPFHERRNVPAVGRDNLGDATGRLPRASTSRN